MADSGTVSSSRHSTAVQAPDISASTRLAISAALAKLRFATQSSDAPASASSTAIARAAPPAPRIEHPLSRRVGNSAQRGEKALAVGVLPNPSAVAAYRAIHRPDESGRLGELIKQFDDAPPCAVASS